MLGGFNLVKRENHHYKYAHCVNIDDIKQVNVNFKEDYSNNEKKWDWNLDNYIHDGSKNFLSGSTMIKFEVQLPKTKNAANFFNNCKSLKVAKTNYSDFTNVEGIFYNARTPMPENFHPNTTRFNDVFRDDLAGFETEPDPAPVVITYNESIDNATDLYGCFADCSVGQTWWFRQTYLDKKYSFPNVTDAKMLFSNNWPYTNTGLAGEYDLDFSNVTKMDRAFSGAMGLTHLTGNFKNLSSGNYMFRNCKLDKSSILNLKNTLKTWEDGSIHELGDVGIYSGYKHDPELLQAIEEIKEKGWNITPTFNISSMLSPPSEWPTNEVICEDIVNSLELDTIQLPEGYIRCYYLEDTGVQWIDTTVLPNNNIGGWNVIQQIVLDIDGNAFGATFNGQSWYTPRWSQNKHTVYYGWTTETNTRIVGTGSTAITSLNWLNDKKAIINLGENDSLTYDLSDQEFEISNSITLFKRNGVTTKQWYGRIYRAKISENAQIIHDYIPCLDSDGKPCMRDILNGVDYYNQGTGDDFLYKVYDN